MDIIDDSVKGILFGTNGNSNSSCSCSLFSSWDSSSTSLLLSFIRALLFNSLRFFVSVSFNTNLKAFQRTSYLRKSLF